MRRLLFALFCCAGLLAAWASITDVSVPMQAVQLGAHSYFVPGLPGAASSETRASCPTPGLSSRAAFNEANRVNAYNQHLRLAQQGME